MPRVDGNPKSRLVSVANTTRLLAVVRGPFPSKGGLGEAQGLD